MSVDNGEIRCSICHDTEESENFTTLECGHEFHSSCIIQWFRSDQVECPMCRGTPSFILTRMEAHARSSMILRKAKKKGAPKELKKLVEKYRKVQKEQKEFQKELKEFNKENAEIFKKRNVMRRKKWQLMSKVSSIKSSIGMWDLDSNFGIGWRRKRYSIHGIW